MSEEIDNLKICWKAAMDRKKQATNDVNHYARLITEARKKENGE